jgi:hypothetical protein
MEKAREYKVANGNMNISWCVTLSTINIYYLPETIEEYMKSFQDFGIYLNLVHGPLHFNISKLPNEVKHIVIDKIETVPKEYESVRHQLPGITGFIKNGHYDSKTWDEFLFLIKKHDVYRGQEFEKTFKEYSEIIEKYGKGS